MVLVVMELDRVVTCSARGVEVAVLSCRRCMVLVLFQVFERSCGRQWEEVWFGW